MPRSAPTPCRAHGCSSLVEGGGFCKAHRNLAHKTYNKRRRENPDTHDGFYATARWRAVRAGQLREFPLCAMCRAKGKLTPATVVDHIKPIRHGGDRYDSANLQSLCWSCHSSKTRMEEG